MKVKKSSALGWGWDGRFKPTDELGLNEAVLVSLALRQAVKDHDESWLYRIK